MEKKEIGKRIFPALLPKPRRAHFSAFSFTFPKEGYEKKAQHTVTGT
jgi:hypothetical protein